MVNPDTMFILTDVQNFPGQLDRTVVTLSTVCIVMIDYNVKKPTNVVVDICWL